jgi:CBS domain-containing protein/ribosome-associated translation inhibitor RaiA
LNMQGIPRITDIASRPVADFLSEPVVVEPEDPVSEIMGRMVAERINEVFIQEDSRTGVITLRSVLRAGELGERKASTLAVTPPIVSLNDTVSKVAKIMSNMRMRSLPVFDSNGKLKGAVSSSILLRRLTQSSAKGKAMSDVMTSRPVTVDLSDSLDKARSLMVQHDFDHLPVVRDGRLAGVITSLDIVAVMGPTEKRGRTSKLPEPNSKGGVQVGGVLKGTPVTSAPLDDSLVVLRSVLDQERTCSIVVADGGVEGIATLRDYVRLLAIEPELKEPPIYVVGLPEQDFESSQAEEKFRRSVEGLSHVYHGIDEARAIVKTKSLDKSRRRFEVQVMIRIPGEQFDLTEEGWSVAEVFEKVGEKIKRLMTKPKDSPSHHRRSSREEIESARYSE